MVVIRNILILSHDKEWIDNESVGRSGRVELSSDPSPSGEILGAFVNSAAPSPMTPALLSSPLLLSWTKNSLRSNEERHGQHIN